jgi:hypothetical protein
MTIAAGLAWLGCSLWTTALLLPMASTSMSHPPSLIRVLRGAGTAQLPLQCSDYCASNFSAILLLLRTCNSVMLGIVGFFVLMDLPSHLQVSFALLL